MSIRKLNLTDIGLDESVIVRLPHGCLLEIEWLDSAPDQIRVVGFQNERHYLADEEYRKAGLEPKLRCLEGLISLDLCQPIKTCSPAA